MEYKPKYEYHLQTWGGFYNEEFQKIHGFKEGNYDFNSLEDRTNYLNKLHLAENQLNARMLATVLSEGYTCNEICILHRVTEFEGKEYYTTRELSVNASYDGAKYMLEWKWTPGCNDYPLGEDFDYDGRTDWKIIQEWITGAFTPEKD